MKIILIVWDLDSSSQVTTFKSGLKDKSFIRGVLNSIVGVQIFVIVHFAIRLNFLKELLVLNVLVGSWSSVSFKFCDWDIILFIDVGKTIFCVVIRRWFYCIVNNLFLVFRNNWFVFKSNFKFFNCLRRHRRNTGFKLICRFDEKRSVK